MNTPCFLMMSPMRKTMMPTNAGSAAFATAIVDDTDAKKYATTAAQHE